LVLIMASLTNLVERTFIYVSIFSTARGFS
jgi:hypothetical protein